MIFEFYEQNYVEKVYLKLNLVQSTKQEKPVSWFNDNSNDVNNIYSLQKITPKSTILQYNFIRISKVSTCKQVT